MNNSDFAQSNHSPSDSLLALESLVEKIHSSFSKPNQERITHNAISEVLSGLDLSIVEPASASPRLVIHRLIFTGEKQLHSQNHSQPFRYDQKFQSGVNVLLIPDNDVGKSSIMKTIKYALTGDDSNYDADVKAWVQRIWLQFSVGDDIFTIYICRINQIRGILVLKQEERCLEELSAISSKFFDVTGAEDLREKLQHFFFERLAIKQLSWTQRDSSTPDGIAMRNASWRTFFQAMVIPDSSDQYLLCDPQHAIGNQDGIILSTFLGLRLVEPMNQLLIKVSLAKKQSTLKEDQIQQAQTELERLSTELASVEQIIQNILNHRQARLQTFRNESPTQRLFEIGARLVELSNEILEVKEQLQNRTREMRRAYSSARGLRELAAIKLNLTGLEVMICPNCDTDVDEQAILQEQQMHICRLCQKPAPPASPSTIEQFETQAVDYEKHAKTIERTKNRLNKQLKQYQQEQQELEQEQNLLKSRIYEGYEAIEPTVEEEAQLAELYRQSGSLRGQIVSLRHRMESSSADTDDEELQLKIVERAREVLRKEAERLNASILTRLSTRTQELAKAIGVESITDISCSALGRIELLKHGVRVKFTGIQNSGERLRVKLAFFLAMMRIGREIGIGRHPGFLLIDQLAAAEMVADDCNALAKVLHQLDKELYKEVQVICFTAQSEFAQATDSEKVYGPQAGKFAF